MLTIHYTDSVNDTCCLLILGKLLLIHCEKDGKYARVGDGIDGVGEAAERRWHKAESKSI